MIDRKGMTEQYKEELLSAYCRVNLIEGSEGVSNIDELDKSILNHGYSRGIFHYFRECGEHIIYIMHSQLIKDDGGKEGLLWLIKALAGNEKTVYLFVGENVYDEVKERLWDIYEFAVKEAQCNTDKYEDDRYVLKIIDNRTGLFKLDYLKIYPNGDIVIFIEGDYKIYEYRDVIDKQQLKSIEKYVRHVMSQRKEETILWFTNDRCFMQTFEITYGLRWCGITTNNIDNNDYFLTADMEKEIAGIMELNYVDKYFVKKEF